MDYTCIRTETRDAVGLVVLDRPKVLNALNRALIDELGDALAGFDADDAIGAMVVTGNEKAFAAGADISEMVDKDSMDMFAARHFEGWERIEKVRKPVIAAVAGYALGGGCELAMACDIVIAADNARFGQPEIKLGVTPGLGGTQRLPRVAGKAKAMDMCLTARMMDADEAERSGLASRVVPLDRLLDEAMEAADGHRLDVASRGADGQGGDRPSLRNDPRIGTGRRAGTVQHVCSPPPTSTKACAHFSRSDRHAGSIADGGRRIGGTNPVGPMPPHGAFGEAESTRHLTSAPAAARLSRILVRLDTDEDSAPLRSQGEAQPSDR